jgi:hypothetical protein
VASLKSLQQTGDGRVKGDAFARGTLSAAPRWPFATLGSRSTLAIPTCPRCRRGQGTMLNHRAGQLATQHSVGAREARLCIRPHASP